MSQTHRRTIYFWCGILLCFQKNTELISMSYVDFSLQQKNEIKKNTVS